GLRAARPASRRPRGPASAGAAGRRGRRRSRTRGRGCAMEVIPALDLRGGCAVHADGGDRSRYPVVEGVLGSGTDPVVLATRFRDRLGCATVYVADLDAIAGLGDSRDIVARLAATGLALTVDAGIRTPDAAAALLDAGAARVVVALETLRSMAELGAVVRAVG